MLLLYRKGLKCDIAGIKKISIDVMNTAAQYADRGKYLVQKIFGYISGNYHQLKDIEWNCNDILEVATVSIGETTFEKILKGIGWNNTQEALRHIAKNGCLIRQSKNRYKTRTTRDRVPYYSYYFDVAKVKEQFSGDFELEFSSLAQRHQWENYIEVINDSEAIINGYNCRISDQGRTFEGKIFFL